MEENKANAIDELSCELLNAGATAAREGLRRSVNPHMAGSEAWRTWMEGFDHQTIYIEQGRGEFVPPANLGKLI